MNYDKLSQFIADNGEIEMGPVRIFGGGGRDIDVYIDNRLVAWLSAANSDVSVMESSRDSFTKEIEVVKEVEKVVEASSKEDYILLGKVEAYEKLLLGRAVTISS